MKRRSRVLGAISLWDVTEGVAALEFALVASILTLVFTGAVSLGSASWTKMQVGNAARAGAFYAAVKHSSDQAKITAAAQSATALSNVTVNAPLATQSCIDPASGTIFSASNASPCPGTGSPPGDYVTVTTQVTYSFIVPIPGIADVGTLSGKAVARIK